MPAALDHLTVVAPSLASGATWVRNALGVEPSPGGRHARMGTHNLLLRLGDSAYLEIIAIDPDAARPDRPRWFGLDFLAADAAPRLATWVVRTADIEATCALDPDVFGAVEPMTRGALCWLITVPSDGALPLGGAAPTLIEWSDERHPAHSLPDAGCALVRLEVRHHEPDRLASLLRALDFEGPVDVSASTTGPGLAADISTPSGLRRLLLSSPNGPSAGAARSEDLQTPSR